jgi:hypothetical protein
VAAVAACVVVFAIYPGSVVMPVTFLCLFGIPIVWLAYFAGTPRPLGTGDAGLERRDLRSDLVQLVITVVVVLIAAAVVTGYDADSLVAQATTAMIEVFTTLGTSPVPTADQIQPLVRVYVNLLPFVIALILTAIFVFDLWVGARVARGSGRMTGTVAPLWSVELPTAFLPAFVVALVLAFFPGVPGEIGKAGAGALFCTFVLTGLAVLHALTRGSSSRVPVLILCYLLLIFSGLPAILLAIVGVAENFMRLRQRRAIGKTPSH